MIYLLTCLKEKDIFSVSPKKRISTLFWGYYIVGGRKDWGLWESRLEYWLPPTLKKNDLKIIWLFWVSVSPFTKEKYLYLSFKKKCDNLMENYT